MEPAIKPAAIRSKTKVVGILATKGTLEGRLFKSTKEKYTEGVKVLIQIGEGLVEIVEENKMNAPETEVLLRSYIEPMLEEGIDQLVLGCTHYPFLAPAIQKITGTRVHLLNPAPAVARQTRAILEQNHLLVDQSIPQAPPTYHFYNSGDINLLKQFVKEQLGEISTNTYFFN